MTSLIYTFRKLVLLSTARGEWGLQSPGKSWTTVGRRGLTDQDIRKHLQGEWWIGTRAAKGWATGVILFDIDGKSDPAGMESVMSRYCQLRELLGLQYEPMVWATPSGKGIRVAYAIPETPVSDLRISDTRGLVPQALRNGGMEVGNGSVETFPATNKIDRAAFGASMPLLKPESLDFDLGESGRAFTEDELGECLTRLERLRARPEPGLLQRLQELAGEPEPRPTKAFPKKSTSSRKTRAERATGAVGRTQARGQSSTLAPMLLYLDGLQGPSSRYESEFRVGTLIAAAPEAFGVHDPSREVLASLVASWLREKNNGWSSEWRETEGEFGAAQAERAWRNRYLTQGSDNRAPVDRMLAAGRSRRRAGEGSWYPSRGEIKRLHEMVQQREWEGRSPYSFLVWSAHFIEEAKRRMLDGGLSGDPDFGLAQIAAEWMREWPFGSHYQEFLSVLSQAGFATIVRGEEWEPRVGRSGKARLYQVALDPRREPRGSIPGRALEVERWTRGIRFGKRRPGTSEALLALALPGSERELRRVYGPTATQRILTLRRALERRSILIAS